MQRREEDNRYLEKLVAVNRVSKTVKGGRNMRFSALMVVGDTLINCFKIGKDSSYSFSLYPIVLFVTILKPKSEYKPIALKLDG